VIQSVCVLLYFYPGGDLDLVAHRPMGTHVPVGTLNEAAMANPSHELQNSV